MAVIEEGRLKGSFKGLRNRDTIFEFQNGRKWRQREYKYVYHYSYMPQARVVERGGGYELEVDGIGDSVGVERA